MCFKMITSVAFLYFSWYMNRLTDAYHCQTGCQRQLCLHQFYKHKLCQTPFFLLFNAKTVSSHSNFIKSLCVSTKNTRSRQLSLFCGRSAYVRKAVGSLSLLQDKFALLCRKRKDFLCFLWQVTSLWHTGSLHAASGAFSADAANSAA